MTNAMRSIDYEKQAVADVVSAAKAAGYRVFLAERGTYGFYTDQGGTRVISFQCNAIESPKISGSYKTNQPSKTGTGWRIADSFNADALDDYFNAHPPRWAIGDAKWSYTTLEQHQAMYQSSSRYTEV